MASEKQDF